MENAPTKKCLSCGQVQPLKARFCNHCGHPLGLNGEEQQSFHSEAPPELEDAPSTRPPSIGIVQVLTALIFLVIVYIVVVVVRNADTVKSVLPSSLDQALASHYTIRISGTDGLGFTGSYMQMQASGGSTSKSVDGTIPAEYEIEGSITSAAFQKKGESGTLHVVLEKNGTVVKEEETTAAYGMVSVAQ